MNKLYAGFGRVNVTPMMGIGIVGYFKPRFAEGVLDDLEINALALACGEDKAVLLSLDNCEINQKISADFRKHISEETGVPMEGIYIHTTHTHTGPFLVQDSQDPLEREYYQMVYHKMADVARFALEDLKPARMGWGVGQAPNIAFVRRFRMKDGSIKTNPGVNNPDIVDPIGEVDERVSVLRFDQEGGESLVLVNFGAHPDTVGGCKISGDWPNFLRKTVETSLENTKCIFFNGAQGDVNHVNVHPKGGDLNDMFMDFDDVSRGYNHARYMGRVVAGGVLQVYDKVKYVDVESLKCKQRTIQVPSNMPDPKDMPEAYRIDALHQAGKDEEIPYTGMMLTTVVAEAGRMIRLEHGPESFDMMLSGIAIGDVVLLGIPGEPFTGIGRGLKEAEGWDLVLPTCLTNGGQGYFPMKEAYDEGGYEARSSNFRAGVGELIIEEGKKLMSELR
ncbi:MAG: hypothetical protein E7293_06055 [Lachnospiraceae bacterium]|nr:hypothetical protein [Lachnospiraceae bacterium]